MPPVKKGIDASKVLAWHPAAQPSLKESRCRGWCLRTAKKKERSHPLPGSTHRPLTEGTRSKVMDVMPTSRRLYDKASLL